MALPTEARTMRLTLRALARLLDYPGPELRGQLSALPAALDEEGALSAPRRAALETFMAWLAAQDALDAEAAYVELFDRGRATSLHLFEHVHGDSRERGPAMLALARTYAEAGLQLRADELPDYLPVVLEYASTLPPADARDFLAETAHLLNAIFSALAGRDSPYAGLLAALIELTGAPAESVPCAAEEPLDVAWEEPPVFGGCATRGQAQPAAPASVPLVRRPAAHAGDLA